MTFSGLVQVSEDVIVDLTGNPLSLQHLLDGLACRCCFDLFALLGFLLLQTQTGVTSEQITSPCNAAWETPCFTHLLLVDPLFLLLLYPLLLLCKHSG